MVDDSPSTGKKAVSAVLELIALALGLGAEEAWRGGKSWHQWVPEGIAGLICQIGVFTWPQVWSFIQQGNPWRQLKEAKSRIEEVSRLIPPPSKLKIHSASWGSAGSRKPVLEAVERQPKDALVLGVSNEVLGCDPAWGHDNKYVEVEYSYGDGPMLKATRKQGRLLILPEDKQFIEDTAAEYERKRKSDVVAIEKALEEERGISAANREEIGKYMRELQRIEGENIKLQSQIDLARTIAEDLQASITKPKLVPVITQYDVREIVGTSKNAPTSTVFHTTYNTIIIRAKLKISNEHSVGTRVCSVGISVYDNSLGDARVGGVPIKTEKELLEPIVLGYPREGWIEFSFDHTDMQWIVRRKFQVILVDGADSKWTTAPETIHHVTQQSDVP